MERQVRPEIGKGGGTAGRRRLAVATMTLAVALLGAACSGASAAPASTPSATATTDAGPVSFARWTARQGFGGGSGTREIQKGAHWLQESPFASDRQSWMEWWASTADNLRIWLDDNPPTPCWADLHRAALADLHQIADAFAAMRLSVDAGGPVPSDASAEMVLAADDLTALEPEPGCP